MYGDEQADAGRDCLPKPSRETNFSGTNADRGIFIFPVQLTTSRIGNLTRLIHTLDICATIHSTVNVPVYRPPVYRFALFTGVFFSCHPVTPVYRWYAGIPGWFIFSCTQHNTTRWVLRAAANTCLHTMPCAAGELCQLSDSTTTPELSCCGPCGGRLHRICGDPDDDEEVNRICEPCAAAKKSTSSTNDHSNAAKRKNKSQFDQ